MALALSQDRVGPIFRTMEGGPMVFNTIHGVDPRDPGTGTTPFQFDRNIRLLSLRIRVDAMARKGFLDTLRELGMTTREIGPRPQLAGCGALGAESSSAFDSYGQTRAKELGIDLATIPERPPRGGGAGGGRGGADSTIAGCGGADSTAGGGGGWGDRPVVYNQQPICAVPAGNLYNDDRILSVAHQYLKNTAWHLKQPNL
jgi:hypothetical protein